MVEVDLKRRRAEADLQDLIIQKETLMKELEGKSLKKVNSYALGILKNIIS